MTRSETEMPSSEAEMPSSEADPVVYEVVSGGTKRGKPKLVDSLGYTYTQKTLKGTKGVIYWICCVRTKEQACRASVRERDGEFYAGKHPHCHPAKPGADISTEIAAEVKRRGMVEVDKSAKQIVKEVLEEQIQAGHPADILPKKDYLVRRVNRARRSFLADGTCPDVVKGRPRARRVKKSKEKVELAATVPYESDFGCMKKAEEGDYGCMNEDEEEEDVEFGYMKEEEEEEEEGMTSAIPFVHPPVKAEIDDDYDEYAREESYERIPSPTHSPVPTPALAAVTYHILNNGTQKGHPQLLDSRGHTYTLQRQGKGRTNWRCSVRSRTVTCHAAVSQSGYRFTPGTHQHCHPSRPKTWLKYTETDDGLKAGQYGETDYNSVETDDNSVKSEQYGEMDDSRTEDNSVRSEQYAETDENSVKPEAIEVKVEVMDDDGETDETDEFTQDDPLEPHPTEHFLLGHFRNLRPIFDFNTDAQLIPNGFLRSDVCLNDARHFLLLTAQQVALLGRVKTVYIDKTYQIVRKPFQQILSIHAFVKGSRGLGCRLVPLAFVLMSRRRRRDYVAVLRQVNLAVPTFRLGVREAVMDFDIPLWQAIKEVYMNDQVVCRGCYYHWTRAVWEKCLDYQIDVPYQTDGYVKEVVDRLMSLPLLPAEHIENVFIELQEIAEIKPSLTRLFRDVEATWILGFFTVVDWSSFRNPIRLDSDVEGWIRRISSETNDPSLPFQEVAVMLFRLSQVVGGQMKVAERSWVIKEQGKRFERLYDHWQAYEDSRLNVSEFLSACGELKGILWW